MKVRVFSASWCNNCGPFKESLKKFLEGQSDLELVEVDVDDPEGNLLAVKNHIRSVPVTQVLTDDGLIQSQVVGSVPMSKIEQMLNQ